MKHINELARLRAMIDDLDDRILELVEQRLEAARDVAAAKREGAANSLNLCPRREGEIVARLEARISAAGGAAVRHIWRELMGHCLQVQAETEIVITSADEELHAPMRDIFGSAPRLVRVGSAQEALRLASEGEAIAVLPLPLPPLALGLRAFRTIRNEAGEAIAAAIGRVALEQCCPGAEERPVSWEPASWRSRTASQMPIYADASEIKAVEDRLSQAAPVAAIDEAAELRLAIARAAEGGAFLLQGGDCAESFDGFSFEAVKANHDLLVEVGRLLPADVVHVARAAGQFAKPRSSAVELCGSGFIPSYRGDAVNGAGSGRLERAPDPGRLLRAHSQSVATAKVFDALASASRLGRCGAERVYSSHEALLLNYEQALTRRDERTGRWWATSGHMVWVGERTRDLDGAHVEYARGIANSIGVKCGPDMTAEQLLRLIDRLDPGNEAGRLVLIGRFGAQHVGRTLPRLMQATRAEGRKALWVTDPMHGNSRMVDGYKTRIIEDLSLEISRFFDIAAAEGVHAGGLHLEMTARPVTECIGGRSGLAAADLCLRYESLCDPRLNAEQSIEIAHEVAGRLSRLRVQRERAA